jgi:hypothetical protein
MVSIAVCQISILDECITISPSYIEIDTRSSVCAGVQLPTGICHYLLSL